MRKALLFVGLITLLVDLKAQDPEFTQFYANPLYLNPAFAGSIRGVRFTSNYRNQWPSIPGNFVTYAASWDQNFDMISGGLGFQIIQDKAGEGELSSTVANFMYSYHLNVSRTFALKFGLQTSIIQKEIDFSKLRWYDMIDKRLGFVHPTEEVLPSQGVFKIKPFQDFSAGILGYTEKFYAGVTVNHISEPEHSFYNDAKSVLPMKLTTHVGMLIPLDHERKHHTFFSPNVLFQKQDEFMQINVGAYYINKNLIGGVWYRQSSVTADAVMFLIGVKKDQLKFGYSYDITMSDIRIGSLGSHELSLIIEIKTYKKPPPSRWRPLDCPSF